MRLLQKYVLGELIRVFLLVVSVLTILLVFLGTFTKASEDGLGPGEILQILPYLVPSLLPFTIPATMLLTVTLVYGRIAADHEVTAAKAAGVGGPIAAHAVVRDGYRARSDVALAHGPGRLPGR